MSNLRSAPAPTPTQGAAATSQFAGITTASQSGIAVTPEAAVDGAPTIPDLNNTAKPKPGRSSRQTVGRQWVRRSIAAAVVAVAALCTVSVPQASAYTVSSTGTRGLVSVPSDFVREGRQYVDGVVYPAIKVPQIVAYRSPAAAGAQTVVRIITIESYQGGRWVQIFNQTYLNSIAANGSAAGFLMQTVAVPRIGYFRVFDSLAWNSASQTLGSYVRSYNAASDYLCTSFSCRVGAGWIYFAL